MFYAAVALSLSMLLPAPAGQAPRPGAAVVSPDGDFSIAIPGAPQLGAITTPLSPKLVTRTWSVNDGPRNEYLVSWTDYGKNATPLPSSASSTRRTCDALVEARNARLLDTSEITVDGKPGRACSFTEDDGRLTKVRFVATETRFYQVMASLTGPGAAEEADRFLNSFKWREK